MSDPSKERGTVVWVDEFDFIPMDLFLSFTTALRPEPAGLEVFRFTTRPSPAPFMSELLEMPFTEKDKKTQVMEKRRSFIESKMGGKPK